MPGFRRALCRAALALFLCATASPLPVLALPASADEQRQERELAGVAARKAWLAGSLTGLRTALERQLALRTRTPASADDPLMGLAQSPAELWPLDIDFAFVLAGNGTTLRGRLDGRPVMVPVTHVIHRGLDAVRGVASGDGEPPASGIVLTISGPALVAMASAPGRHGRRTLLLIGEFLDAPLLTALGEHLDLAGLRFERGAPRAARGLPLRARDGTVLGALVWDGADAAPEGLWRAGLVLALLAVAVLGLALRTLGSDGRSMIAGLHEGWVEAELRRALRRDALDLVFQPLVEIASGRPLGAEALLRWTHPVRGAIPPAVFVPVAERAGLMPQLGRVALRRAVLEAARWDGLKVAVNVSPLQLCEPGFVALVRETLEASGLPPRCLELEITEGVLVADPSGAAAVLRQLRRLGVAIVIDDFGTGYSGLSHLHLLPVDKIKLDRAFAERILEQAQSRAVAQAVAGLARDLGARLCAEGIERPEQARLLAAMGFEEAQGFHFARPVPAADLPCRFRPQRPPGPDAATRRRRPCCCPAPAAQR